MVPNIQAISSPLSHENWNSSTLPVRHSTVRAVAKQSQPLRSPKIWLRRLRESKDLQMALLEWRNTPDINNLSPTQKLMSRGTQTTIPTAALMVYMTTLNVRGSRPKQLTTRVQDHCQSFKLENQYFFSQ